MQKTKIFVSAYACEPDLGSEIGVGWHWVLEMSKYFDLWVLTRKSNQAGIEEWIAEHTEYRDIHFLYFDLPKKLRFWKKGLRGVRTYYVLWQNLSNGIVKRTMRENGIEVYHLLTYGNALWPISSYGQKRTFIWGPTSTGNQVSGEFSKHYGFKNRLKESLQRLMANTLRYNCAFVGRCRDARLILCKTESTRESIPTKYRHKAVVFTDVAVDLFDTSIYRQQKSGDTVRYLAVGRLDSWRGFDLLIEAFAIAVRENRNIHLDILGKGSDMERLNSIVKRMKLSEVVTLVGGVPKEVYYQYMANCDVVVNPTLKEGAVTTAFDSMSFAKPLICINTGGYTRYFSDGYAVVLDMADRRTLIENLSSAILRLTDNSLRENMSAEIVKIRDEFTWEHKGEQIYDTISKSLN